MKLKELKEIQESSLKLEGIKRFEKIARRIEWLHPYTTTELCPYCMQEVVIPVAKISKCPKCKKWIKPCSACDMDKVKCENCKLEV